MRARSETRGWLGGKQIGNAVKAKGALNNPQIRRTPQLQKDKSRGWDRPPVGPLDAGAMHGNFTFYGITLGRFARPGFLGPGGVSVGSQDGGGNLKRKNPVNFPQQRGVSCGRARTKKNYNDF